MFYQLIGLVNGQQYMVGLSAEYEAGESNIIEFELPYVSSDDNTIQMGEVLTNFPNPFNPTTTISFSFATEHTENNEIAIYNLKGQKIRHYSIENNQSSIIWNGTDQTGKQVSSGIYFYRLISDGKHITSKKMLLLK
ncbi:MAG: T9SS type A sorting domain-containing protein [Candidatus Cloacimonetes bacterium]|nr:T9SS type A sorting domain-containing protein [Candidatus Cloacimonadota bacterium]MBT4575393.1 T9SS type A sorting domain-containing protein [Candidatus Cloacimonadota bacterium]